MSSFSSTANASVSGAVHDVSEPIRVEHVTKRFRQGDTVIEALRSISLGISSGEFVAVMGASGCGKSTLLHALAGLTGLDEGRVVIDGTDLSRLSDSQLTTFRRRRIGLIFQAFNLIPTLTAEENILLPLAVDGVESARGQLQLLAEKLGISHRLQHRPDALSGGEQQRVAIARALITNPALLLADEPTGSLDSVSGENICRLLRDLCQEQHCTVVVVTHEPAVASWAQRVVVMKDGQVLTEFATRDFSDAQLLSAHYQDIVQCEVSR